MSRLSWSKKPLLLFALAACLIASPRGEAAVPPPNDQCSGAILLAPTSFPFYAPVVDMSDATRIGDPPLPPVRTAFDTNVNRSVWFKFQPPATALYTLSAGADTVLRNTTVKDTSMAIYTSGGGGCSGVTNLFAFNEDSGVLGSAVSTNMVGGTEYYIVVWVGKVETRTNDLFLELKITRPTVAANNLCSGAVVIPSNAQLPYNTPVVDTTLGSTPTTLAPSCAPTGSDRRPSRPVWYTWRPAAAGTYIISTKAGETATSVEDTMITIYTSPNGCSGPFAEEICNDNGVGRGILARPLATNITYYIVVWDNSRDYIPGETDVQLRIAPATAPTVTTLPAISIASTGSVLGGVVNANGLQSRFWFEYGPTAGLGSTSQTKLIFANIATPFTTNLATASLLPNTLYRYRFAASNSIGLVKGDELTFVYSNARPFLAQPTRQGNGGFRFQFEANPIQFYMIQGSTNLLDWEDLGLATNVSGTLFQYLHEQATSETLRCYRVRLP